MKILAWIIGTSLVLFGLLLLTRFALCRPSHSVVETASPMVEKISDHIIEYGVPESLDKIQGLPYELKECQKKEIYYKNNDDIIQDIQQAEWLELLVNCKFYKDNTPYSVHMRLSRHINKYDWLGTLDIQSGKTEVGVSFKVDKNYKLVHDELGSSFDNRFGFCRQLKQ